MSTITTTTTPAEQARKRRIDTHTMAFSGLVFGLFAMAASMFAVALAAQAADEARDANGASSGTSTSETQAGDSSNGGAAAGPVGATLNLKEFSVSPATVTVAAGNALRVTNGGSIPHNLDIEGQATPLLDGGKSADLQLADLAAGTYTMRCTVAGHEAAGMKGTVTIQ